MKNFIILTSKSDDSPIYININHIGHIYTEGKYTRVGVTTHNNGGFTVQESLSTIISYIEFNQEKPKNKTNEQKRKN